MQFLHQQATHMLINVNISYTCQSISELFKNCLDCGFAGL